MFLKDLKPLFRPNAAQATLKTARDLLGMYLAHQSPEGLTIGRIVETEAYLSNDPACHASRGETPRTKVMFGPPWHAYVYLIYGMYYCFNVVTARKGLGEAVLIRALEPVAGLGLMAERRLQRARRKDASRIKAHQLCNGPGKLAIAMGIGPGHNGVNLLKGHLELRVDPHALPKPVVQTTRIGISAGVDLPYRFYLRGNRCISRE